MFVARLQCSDPACAETSVAEATTLAELETLSCECGCGLAVLAWPDWVEDEPVLAAVVPLRARRATDGLSSAA